VSTHTDALLQILSSVPELRVGDADADALDLPYVVLHTTRSATGEALDGAQNDQEITVQITAVGASRRSAEWASQTASDALVGVVPQVAGWVTGPVRHTIARPVGRDLSDPSRPVYMTIDQYHFYASKETT
jgi:hypothetical protein